ncbi:MAG TPA: hypothetical protein VG847_03935 [Chitinophagaceae bacterium]|nr:hypothetical protein [Chitinophagaceae bacterium]
MKIILIPVLIIVFACGCKEITYTPAVLAAYTIGNGDSCTGAVLSGQYVADTPLTASNTLTINVQVTTAGPYWITTNVSNGIFFSQIGTFADTGRQTVVLNGSGTPIAEDTTLFTVTPRSGDSSSCLFVVPVISNGPPHYYLNCLIDGTFINFSGSAFATNSTLPGVSGLPGLDISGADTIAGAVDNIDFGINSAGVIGKGAYYDSATPPAYFIYTDNSGSIWKTDTSFHPAFTISVDNLFRSGLQGTFSGMLRKENATDSMSVSNGTFFVPLR